MRNKKFLVTSASFLLVLGSLFLFNQFTLKTVHAQQDGPFTITLGQSVDLIWTAQTAETCAANPEYPSHGWVGSWNLTGPSDSQTVTVTPTATGSFDYTIRCDNPAGFRTDTVTVIVNAPDEPPPAVDVTGPSTAEIAQPFTINWTSSNAVAVVSSSFDCGFAPAAGSGELNGNRTGTCSTVGIAAFTVEVRNSSGVTARDTHFVTITEPAEPPPNPPTGTIMADPNPCTITSGSSCTSTISWSLQNTVSARVYVVVDGDTANETLFEQNAGFISSGPASFIQLDKVYTFNLYDYTGGYLYFLDSVDVTAQEGASTGPDAPACEVNTTNFTFNAQEGGTNPSPQTWYISNPGSAGTTLQWRVTDNQTWLSVNPFTGSTAAGAAPSAVAVSVNISGLTAANSPYQGTLTLSDNNSNPPPAAGSCPKQATVTLNISPFVPLPGGPVLDVQPASLTFTFTSSDTHFSKSQDLIVTNAGGGTLNWTSYENPSTSWLSYFPGSGSLASGESQTVRVTVSRSGLPISNYSSEIVFEDPNASGSPKNIPIQMNVTGNPPSNQDYRVLVEPDPLIIQRGGAAGSYEVAIVCLNGFGVFPQQFVSNFQITGLPAGVSKVFSRSSLMCTYDLMNLTLTASGSAPTGIYPVTIRGYNGYLGWREQEVGLVIQDEPPPPPIEPAIIRGRVWYDADGDGSYDGLIHQPGTSSCPVSSSLGPTLAISHSINIVGGLDNITTSVNRCDSAGGLYSEDISHQDTDYTVTFNPPAGWEVDGDAVKTVTAAQLQDGVEDVWFAIKISTDPPPPPTGLLAANSVCSQINLSWTDESSDEDGFHIWRYPASGGSTLTYSSRTYSLLSPSLAADTTSFTDSPPVGNSYRYIVTSFNAFGDSTVSGQNEVGPIANNDCAPDLNRSSKLIESVKSAESSSFVPYTGQTINDGDTLKFRIVIDNSAGNATAYDVFVIDTLTDNLQYQPGTARINTSGVSGPGTPITENINGQTITFNAPLDFGSGDKAADNINWILTFDVVVVGDPDQTIEFIENRATIRYALNNGGNPDQGVPVSTGPIPIRSDATRVPEIIEVAP